jgi:hypothetical protein
MKVVTMTSVRSVGVLIALGTISGWACGAPTGPSTLSPGVWGGDHVTLTVSDTATHLELDCAHGDIPSAFSADAGGQFVLAGTFVREHGGPIREGETPDSHPAIYSGSVSSAAMMLTIRLGDSTDVMGPFNLARGSAGRVVKCL